jgi:hypothetical protein
MTASLCRVEDTAPAVLDDRNTPPGLLESWADYHDYCLALEFGPEPPLTEEQ